MYGMVNRGIEELITAEYGPEVWADVKVSAAVDVDIFISNEDYPEEMTPALVLASSKRLGVPEEEIMRKFGIHWVTQTAARDYRDMLSACGTSLREFLCNLPQLHQRISLLFPHLDPPTFRWSELRERSLHLHYHSRRSGYTHFVEGLLLGLGLYFRQPVRVSMVALKSAGSDHDEFLVEW